ncbi:MAG: diacylglycerol kinase family protein [Anaerolineae bacterium]|nr:diacylglycerol kinase family protein [Anaerolineae bacterium]
MAGNDDEHDQTEKRDVLVTPEGEELDLSIGGTMKLDASEYSPVTNKDRLSSLKYGLAGLLYILRREQSIQFATGITVVVIAVGIWLNIGPLSWALLALSLGAVWITECLNTAIEATINLESPEPHPMAKIGKDVAATASLVATVVFVIIVVLILLPRLFDRLALPGT